MMLIRLLKYIEEGNAESVQEDSDNFRLSKRLKNEQMPFRKKKVLVRICGGGKTGNQTKSCEEALLETMHSVFEKVQIVVERMDPGDRIDMGPKKVIDWLLESDYHIISTHLHQGALKWLHIDTTRFL